MGSEAYHLKTLEDMIRKSPNYQVSREEFRKELRSEASDDVIDSIIVYLGKTEKKKIKYDTFTKRFSFTSIYNLKNINDLKMTFSNYSMEPIEENQDLYDEYPNIINDLKSIKAQGYIREIEVSAKKKDEKKKLLFPRNPNDEIEKMNLEKIFEKLRDVKQETKKANVFELPPDEMESKATKKKKVKLS